MLTLLKTSGRCRRRDMSCWGSMLLSWAAAPVAAATACRVSSAGCAEVVCTGAEDCVCVCVCVCACALVEIEVDILSICRPTMLRSSRCDQTGVGQLAARRITSMCYIVQETVDKVVVAVHNERVELVNVWRGGEET